MAETKMRIGHIDKRKSYLEMKASWIKRKLCPQLSPCSTFVVLNSDTSESMSNLEMKEISQEGIRELVEALKTMLDKYLRKHPEPCSELRYDGHLYYGKKGIARKFYLIFHWKLDLFSRTRHLYHLQELIREMHQSRLLEKDLQNGIEKGHQTNKYFAIRQMLLRESVAAYRHIIVPKV